MESRILDVSGFSQLPDYNKDWEDLKKSLQPNFGVYVIKYETPFGRFNGDKSDIVYIGSAAGKGGLKQRISPYLKSPNKIPKIQKTNRRISMMINKEPKKFKIWSKICKKSKNSTDTERKMLEKYFKCYKELPPQNRREGNRQKGV